ncbi:MAG: hypothetical protein KKB50_04320 [Planctomycetes bacterium]|nr:hypothetical protein [Planctomycetota bacterium]
MGRMTILLSILLLSTPVAQADPFYLRYDPHEGRFPEQEGWGRYWSDPEDKLIRSVDNGVFRLDTRGSAYIWDTYEAISSAFILGPAEELRVRWRMHTLETDADYGRSDVVLIVINEAGAYAEVFLAAEYVSEDEILGGTAEHFWPIDPALAHTYDFVSTDMLAYDLYVDGQHAFQGQFHDYAWRPKPRIAFGDAIVGYTSLSEWEYVEIEVIPEPNTALTLLLATMGIVRIRGRCAL